MFSIHQIINAPISSNCFVLYNKLVGNDCAIVDPGSKSNKELFDYIEREELNPQYIILTHEHFDHCWGVNEFVDRYHIPIVCSKECSEAIKSYKRNCSVFYDVNERFSICSKTLAIEDIGYQLPLLGDIICFINTPGHSKASICFYIEGLLFSGDTLIKGAKTVTKLPTGSSEDLKETFCRLKKLISIDSIVFPGHGDTFVFGSVIFNE